MSEAALWKAITEDPADTLAKYALADYFSELGVEGELVEGLRYCAINGKHPDGDDGEWGWLNADVYDGRKESIPEELFRATSRINRAAKEKHTLRWAFQRLGRAIIEVRSKE